MAAVERLRGVREEAYADRSTSSISAIKSLMCSATTPSNSATRKSSSSSTIPRLATSNGFVSLSQPGKFSAGRYRRATPVPERSSSATIRRIPRALACCFHPGYLARHREITLTPGIRWEYIGSPHSTVQLLGNFDPNVPGGVDQGGPGLPGSTQIHPQKDNFNPRLGAAWDIFGNGRTVLRAGVGNLSSFPAILTVTGAASAPCGATLCTGPAHAPRAPARQYCHQSIRHTVQTAVTSATLA